MRSPREVVEAYNLELWNQQRYELAAELIGESVVRHDIGSVTTLTHDEAVQRIVDRWASADHLEFSLVHLIAEGEFVSLTYGCRITLAGADEEIIASSIEVFRVVDGKICEVWNAPSAMGAYA